MEQDCPSTSAVKAIVAGKEYTEIPTDLYIPPDALEVLLDSFSGPLDLLLYLIHKQNIDILNIPIISITEQYLQYIQIIGAGKLELAAEYLLMAAVLAEIKSRMLLPIVVEASEEEDEDPRMALVRRLLAYEQIKQAALWLDELPRQDRDHFTVQLSPPLMETIKVHPAVELSELLDAMLGLVEKEEHFSKHEISQELLSVRDRMNQILLSLQEGTYLSFHQLFTKEEGRAGLVVSLLAILELARQALLVITQAEPFAALHIKAA